MSKKEEFKNFVRTKPELVDYVKNKEMSWQQFYELYDLYGEDESAWSSYKKSDRVSEIPNLGIGKFGEIVKNIDVDSIQKHIETAQKALGFVQDLTTKGTPDVGAISKGPSAPRPLNKFFED